ncbi:MAG: hypothetical protein LIO81_11870 [Clostridiales bacterium]|nr:hypothetical protein [Clostridiales bacterium]
MAKVLLKDVAFARSGDKGDVATIGIIALNENYYEQLKRELVPEKISNYFNGLIEGKIEVYPEDNLRCFQIVCNKGLGGGATRTLRYDSTAKSYGCTLLRMEVNII